MVEGRGWYKVGRWRRWYEGRWWYRCLIVLVANFVFWFSIVMNE